MTAPSVEATSVPRNTPILGFRRLLLSEWTKLRSVRSTMWALILLVVVTIGFTGLFMWLTVAQWNSADPARRAQLLFDPVSAILGSGLELGQLTICVLGVMVMTSEYSTGAIRASLLAVPRRWPMLVGKVLVFGVVVFVVGELVAFPSFFLGAAILHSRVSVSLSDPGVLRAVIGAGLYLCVLGLFSMAIGTLVRHTAGAITGVIGFVLVLAPLSQLIPGNLGKYIHAYLPSEAGVLIATGHAPPDAVLSPWQGFGVFCLWTLVLLIAGGYLLRRRDA